MQVEWTKSEKGTKYGTQYEVLEGSFRWAQTIICTMSPRTPWNSHTGQSLTGPPLSPAALP